MRKLQGVFANQRTMTVLKVAGTVVVLLGLLVSGAAAQPIIIPN
jgi:hypothetical protein